MNRLSRRCAALLAGIIALRALVPVGYMLSVPVVPGERLALTLCPLQNAALDISVLSGPGAGAGAHSAHNHHHHHHHHGHEHGDAGPDGPGTVTVSSADCSLWLASAAPAAPSFGVPAQTTAPARGPEAAAALVLHGRTPFHPAQPRAPPAAATV